MANLEKNALLGKVLEAIREGGWLPNVVESSHPFLVRAMSPEQNFIEVRVYIWNCTPGGTNRAADEFRIQFTSRPVARAYEATLLLGWHDDAQVFVAWDIAAHDGQNSSSPSAQVKESTLLAAHERAFALQDKDNETVIAFQSLFFVEYVLASRSLHQTGSAFRDLNLLNQLETLDDTVVNSVGDANRRTVIQHIARKYRAASFRQNVLTAYAHQCAFCRVQLDLLDAAHILPVSAPGSTDEIDNGIALCKLHHHAYDSNLLSFDGSYRLLVNEDRMQYLDFSGLGGGARPFRVALGTHLALPANPRNYPGQNYIRESLRVRGWGL